jgi:hypothetical protein
MFQGIKKILIVSVMVLMSSLSNSWAFDLGDYATTLRNSSQEYSDAQSNFKTVEPVYFKAFMDRMDVETAGREAQLNAEKAKLAAAEPESPEAIEAAAQILIVEAEIKKLADLKKSYLACPK